MQQCRSVSHLSACMLLLVLVLTVATHLLAGKFVSHIDYWDAVSVLDESSTPCCCQLMDEATAEIVERRVHSRLDPLTNAACGVRFSDG